MMGENRARQTMLVIGVTGGIASGKTMVTRELGRRGAAILDADRIGHDVLELTEVKRALWRRWGAAVFQTPADAQQELLAAEQTPDHVELARVDRVAIARRVFAPGPASVRELAFLEQLTHPQIGARIAERIAHYRRDGVVPAAILDAPVLYKAGWESCCDKILFVDAPLDVRAARAAARGWSGDQLKARQAMQPPIEYQRERADDIIDNGGSHAATIRQIDTFWGKLFRAGKE